MPGSSRDGAYGTIYSDRGIGLGRPLGRSACGVTEILLSKCSLVALHPPLERLHAAGGLFDLGPTPGVAALLDRYLEVPNSALASMNTTCRRSSSASSSSGSDDWPKCRSDSCISVYWPSALPASVRSSSAPSLNRSSAAACRRAATMSCREKTPPCSCFSCCRLRLGTLANCGQSGWPHCSSVDQKVRHGTNRGLRIAGPAPQTSGVEEFKSKRTSRFLTPRRAQL